MGTKVLSAGLKGETRALAAAARLYAEHGFEVPLSRIARAAREPAARLRRRVGGRKRLRARVLAELFAGRWKEEWDALLVDRSLPLEERLARFYTEYRGNIERNGARLWTRAGLLGMHGPGFSRTLEKRILMPVARELRHEAGVASKRAVSGREVELVQMLHGAIAFPHTRSHIFDMDVHGRLPDLIAMMVRVWLPGALAEAKRLNTAPLQEAQERHSRAASFRKRST
jgi:AcrR family transcriptional regulator